MAGLRSGKRRQTCSAGFSSDDFAGSDNSDTLGNCSSFCPAPVPHAGLATRPRVVRQQQSESAYIFGAVCPRCDAAVGLVLPFANTQTMALHLEAISLAVPASRHAVLVLDQAGWPKLPQLLNVSLLSLLARSPELNPAEQVWQQLRDRSPANRCYDSYDDIIDAYCEAWNKFT